MCPLIRAQWMMATQAPFHPLSCLSTLLHMHDTTFHLIAFTSSDLLLPHCIDGCVCLNVVHAPAVKAQLRALAVHTAGGWRGAAQRRQGRWEQGRAGGSRAGQGRAGQGSAGQSKPAQDHTTQRAHEQANKENEINDLHEFYMQSLSHSHNKGTRRGAAHATWSAQ